MTSYSVSSHSHRSRRSGDYVPSRHATYAQDYAPEYTHSGYGQGYPQQGYAGSHRRHQSLGGGYREPYYSDDASHSGGYVPSSHTYSSHGHGHGHSHGHGHGHHGNVQYIVSDSGHRSHHRSPTYYTSSSSSRSHGHGHHREPSYYVTSDTGHRHHRSSSVSYARPGLAERVMNMLGVGGSSKTYYTTHDSGRHHSRGRRSGDYRYVDARSGAEVDRRGRQIYTVSFP